jgi:hypothetical protein
MVVGSAALHSVLCCPSEPRGPRLALCPNEGMSGMAQDPVAESVNALSQFFIGADTLGDTLWASPT